MKKHAHSVWGSFAAAFRGLWLGLVHEGHFRAHVAVTVAVLVSGWWFGFAAWEWIAVLLPIALVLSAELVNSALERVVDSLRPRIDPVARDVKDFMAASVLVLAIFSLLVAAVVFLPHLGKIFLTSAK